jgi:hypothetical protein
LLNSDQDEGTQNGPDRRAIRAVGLLEVQPLAGGLGAVGVLGDHPAVLAWQVGQKSEYERFGAPSWLYPGEPARYPAQQEVCRAWLEAEVLNVSGYSADPSRLI